MNELAIEGDNFAITRHGIEFRGELTRTEWEQIGEKLAHTANAVFFAIGDWINYGENRWGDMYGDAKRITLLDYGTLRNFAYVARRIELSCRHDKLGFEHHAVVAKIKEPTEQRRWLELAAEHALSKRRLRVSVNKGRIVSVDELSHADSENGHTTYMTWLNKLLQWWRKRTDGEPVETWDPVDRARLKRDLEPWVKIYQQL